MKDKLYIPDKGDIVWIDFDPSSGREIQKRRPGVVVSKYNFNKSTWFAVICPITSTQIHNQTRFSLSSEYKTQGQVVIPQLKSFDFQARNVKFIEKLTEPDIKNIDQIIGYIF